VWDKHLLAGHYDSDTSQLVHDFPDEKQPDYDLSIEQPVLSLQISALRSAHWRLGSHPI
jgi:hypothetical protein